MILSARFAPPLLAAPAAVPDYAAVEALFTEYCLDCHGSQDPEGKLVLESFDLLMKGGESGPEIVPGKSEESRLVRLVEGRDEKDGKTRIMPPGKKREKLKPEQIALIRAWIDAGAKPPAEFKPRELVVPKIELKTAPRRPVQALAWSPGLKELAAGRYRQVELISAESRAVVRTLQGHRGSVNALAFAADGRHLFAAGGEAGWVGEVRQWDAASGEQVRLYEGHKDAVYALALSPDGKTLATGSYDQKIKLWDVASGAEVRTLTGHNGAVFGLAFRPDGRILASASADRTVKLWDVAAGERRDTLAQPLKEQYTVAFSPDGRRLVAAGVDNRLRVWEISEGAAETTNPILESRFAHEGAILKIAFSADGKSLASTADDGTVKIWDATGPELKERIQLEKQPDWTPALTFALDNKAIAVGRLDGSVEFYGATDGKVLPVPKPELQRADPRGVQRGREARLRLIGKNLAAVTAVQSRDPRVRVERETDSEPQPDEVRVRVTTPRDLPRGGYALSVAGPGGESATVSLQVDDLPQVQFEGTNTTTRLQTLPVDVWAAHQNRGQREEIEFDATAGQTLVFDAAARRLGSKSDLVLTLLDSAGRVLAANNGFDGGPDPFLAHTFAVAGRYRVQVAELLLEASPDHFYRLTVGPLAYVTGFFPLSVTASNASPVDFAGYGLPPGARLSVQAGPPDELELAPDPEKFRTLRPLKVLVTADPEPVESEPNDTPAQATPMAVPGAVNGRIFRPDATGGPDVDLFRFEARAGQAWIVETQAAQRGSPVDTKIEVLRADGRPVERLRLQAVRNTAINFRSIDSNGTGARLDNYEEMELNEFVYFNGEVVRLFRMPQGPDSDMLFYSSNGKRRAYFDTSAMAHALDEPAYIVEPHPPGARLAANGLPVFPLHYANDDDAERKLGSDSRLTFTAPADGVYLVRVSDARGYSGDRFAYRLLVRPPRPDFKVTVSGTDPAVNVGSGREFSVNAERSDGFDGDITVDVTGLPPGFAVSAPLVIQAGQSEARGTIRAAMDAPAPEGAAATASRVTATAIIAGQAVTREAGSLGQVSRADKPKLRVFFQPDPQGHPPAAAAAPVAEAPADAGAGAGAAWPLEITLAPGQSIPALLRIERNGHDDLVTFTVENLPHGVIVDNIGLNGVLIPKGENERGIFLTAARWVPEQDRLCYAVENQAGRQTSPPVLLHIRKPAGKMSVAGK